VELVRPSLDSIYLTLTEQRYSSAEPPHADEAFERDGDGGVGAAPSAAIRRSG
jgi:hypothetical protein